jgi:hypothetical protein
VRRRPDPGVPAGSVAQVYPVIDPAKDGTYYAPVEIDLDDLIKQAAPRYFVVDTEAEAALDAHMLELSNELANEADEPS